MPAVSVIIVSHDKPDFANQAVQSVLDQTFKDWEGFLVDSGVLLSRGYFDHVKDPRMKVMASGEEPGMSRRLNMATWCFNKVLNSGAVKGELILYLCDDDYFYPRAFEIFWDYYSALNREPQAMYASQNVGVVDETGRTMLVGQRVADQPAGKFCHKYWRTRRLMGRVDYLQFCHTVKILETFASVYGTRKYHCEDLSNPAPADGLFIEQIGALTMIHPINQVVSVNRRTAQSLTHTTPRLPKKLLNHYERKFRLWWRKKLGWQPKRDFRV